jgi:predicted metal-binding protein
MYKDFEDALAGRAYEFSVIDTMELQFSPELVKACEANVCGNYNRCWTCPPHSGSLEDQKKKIQAYEKAFVFTTKYSLEDSFDYEGMVAAKEIHNGLTRELFEKFGKNHPVYGAGGCKLCEKCACPDPCRHPGKIFPPIEAAGINVTELSFSAKVKYNNGPNSVTYFSMILF